MATYSFMDITASMTGPTGSVDLGYGSANSEEGITVTMTESKNTMTIGADGEVMHSLHAGKSGTVTVNLQKPPSEQKLSLMYNAQSQSSALWEITFLYSAIKPQATSLQSAQQHFKRS